MNRVELDNGVIIERHAAHILTTLPDGSTSANWPHPNDAGYIDIVKQCGFGPDQLLDYVFEHEILHSLMPLRFFGRIGYTVRMAAHERKVDIAGASAEERLIYQIQRCAADPVGYGSPDPQVRELANEVRAMGLRH